MKVKWLPVILSVYSPAYPYVDRWDGHGPLNMMLDVDHEVSAAHIHIALFLCIDLSRQPSYVAGTEMGGYP